MAAALRERNSIFFRFASDKKTIEKVEFDGRQISVGDLKREIAEKKKLPQVDLVLFNEATNQPYTKDGALLHRNTTITVKRTPPQSSRKPSVIHIEHEDVWSRMTEPQKIKSEDVKVEHVKRNPIPKAFLCHLCGDLFNDPSIARCCGRSACFECFKTKAEKTERTAGDLATDAPVAACPLCFEKWTQDGMPIRNRSLANSVAALDLDYFILPEEAKEAAAVASEAAEAAELETKLSAAAVVDAACAQAGRASSGSAYVCQNTTSVPGTIPPPLGYHHGPPLPVHHGWGPPPSPQFFGWPHPMPYVQHPQYFGWQGSFSTPEHGESKRRRHKTSTDEAVAQQAHATHGKRRRRA
eukprot:TRINITY_DN13994_c0_g1_i2.p1 TRINITY_DN13994_c0_g1~~TRINITY_DN13994_c0_g1_i2.p1  ORF type:complete len:370 (+),score=40.72 TRINITY_DN13994_c0_g1_i2:49-1110(+)